MHRTYKRERYNRVPSKDISSRNREPDAAAESTHYRENSKILSLSGPGVVELRSWGAEEELVDLWDYQNTRVKPPGEFSVVCVICDCQIGIKVDLDNRSIEDHLAGNHHRQILRDLQCPDMEKKDSRGKVCFCSQHSCTADQDQSGSKKIKFSKPESSSSAEKSSKHRQRDGECEKHEKTSSRTDYLNHFKMEEKAHQATKEQVKTLKTTISCLNSDVNELQSQVAGIITQLLFLRIF